MADFLARALDQLENGNDEQALELLIKAWRASRASELAEAVDVIDEALGKPAFTGVTMKSMESWTSAADSAAAAVERGPLIRAIFAMTTAQILDALTRVASWDDPRVGTLVVGLLTELRFSGARSQPFWREVFDKIPSYRDPRFARLTKTLPQTWRVGPSMQRWLTNQLKEAADNAAPPSVDEKDRAQITQILELARNKRDAMRASRKASGGEHGGEVSGESLLAEIYANPDDDSARVVYADWLLERGDPRGEFITLQLRPHDDKDKAAQKRERELLKANRKAWLGRLAPVVGGDLVFRRGFLAEATVKFRHQRDVEQYGSLAEWGTLDEVEWGDQLVRDDQVEWSRYLGPAMCNVKVARKPAAKSLLVASTHGDKSKVWALTDLELRSEDTNADTIQKLMASPRLAKLSRLQLTGWRSTPTLFKDVARCPRELVLWLSLSDEKTADWRAEMKKHTTLESLVFREWRETSYRFTRDDKGSFTRLDIEIRPTTKIKTLAEGDFRREIIGIEKLPARSLTRLTATIEIGGEMVEGEPLIAAGAAKLQ